MVDWSASAVADGDFGFTTAGDSVDVDVHIMGISGAYTMGDFTVGANYSTGEADIDYSDATTDDVSLDYMQYGLGAAYSMDAWTFAANYGLQEIDDGTNDRTASGYGLAIHYDLGGGAVVQFGYGFSDDEDISSYFDANTPNLPTALGPLPAGTDTESSAWSFGVSMSF
jgi:outer membrane protein OmpU